MTRSSSLEAYWNVSVGRKSVPRGFCGCSVDLKVETTKVPVVALRIQACLGEKLPCHIVVTSYHQLPPCNRNYQLAFYRCCIEINDYSIDVSFLHMQTHVANTPGNH